MHTVMPTITYYSIYKALGWLPPAGDLLHITYLIHNCIDTKLFAEG